MHAATAPAASSRRHQLLAKLLEKAGVKHSEERIPRRPCAKDHVPVSSGQRRLWFLDRVAPGNPVYNVPTCFRVRGPLDVQSFRQCLDEIVRRHEILRTTFELRHDQPVQVICEHLKIETSVIDVSGCARVNERVLEEARRPFNLERGPLIRALLFRLSHKDHIVLIAMHHIICDGWSMGVLFREIANLYSAATRRTPARLPELLVQYADYSLWQRERLQSGKLQPQIDFWRQHLRNAPTVFELPSDRARPQERSFRGGVLHSLVPAPVSEALLDLARSESTTPFVVLLAAYAVLLHSYSNEIDFIVGCPVSNRSRSELEPLIGFLPNTLPLRVQVPGDPPFIGLLRNLRHTTSEAFANAEAPFEAITEAVGRSGRASLFQVAFMLQDQPPTRLAFDDLEIAPMDLDLGTAKCDLTLVAATGHEELSLAFEYSTDLFEVETVRRMAGHFQTLLEGIAANPEARLSELPMMTATEQQIVLNDWSGSTATIASESRTLHELFEEHAASRPSAPASMFGSNFVTYADLNRHANCVAHALRESGAGPGALIAIALKRSPELIAAILGVLKAGAAYLPISLDHPDERITFQIGDASPMMLVTSEEDRSRLPAAAKDMPWLDVSQVSAGPASDTNLGLRAQPSDLAYVIYTSGSTGRPKGAMLEHRGLTNLALAQQQLFELGPDSRILQFAPPTFDASIWEIAMALGSGGCLCLGAGSAFVPEELTRILQQQRVTTVTLPPSILRTLDPAALPELRTLIAAGENCPETLAREWCQGRSFFNAYGPTEATVCATALRWLPVSSKITIGRPLPNVRTYILDAHMRPVPVGVPGELHIGGAGVARGYFRRPELTREKFVSNPFKPGERLYKTGDLARFLANGEIEFLGRLDDQVKIRGHRIEPGEIEARLESHPAIRECAVIVRKDDSTEARLIAYFVAHNTSPDKDELRAFLTRSLPHYMVPSAFVPLPELPVNSSGKIDRRALAQLEIVTEAAQAPARDELEHEIAAIWAEVLHLPQVGVTDNFFELGGNSLMAVGLMARISAHTGCDLPVTTLFQAGTVEQIARCIRERRNVVSPHSSLVRLQPSGSRPPLFFVAPAGGSLICYSDVARLLGPDQPVYGVEPPRDTEPLHRVEDMAARYIADLRTASISGPYRLAGWSFGGNVAFEMARQLADQGQQVDHVILLDSHTDHNGKEPHETEILVEIARVQALARGVELQLDRRKLRRLSARDRDLLLAAQLERDPRVSPETVASELRSILRQFRANMRAARRYAPGYYSGRVALLRASGSSFWSGDHGWLRYCPNIEIHNVPGTHRTLLGRPHVDVLATTMRNLLASV